MKINASYARFFGPKRLVTHVTNPSALVRPRFNETKATRNFVVTIVTLNHMPIGLKILYGLSINRITQYSSISDDTILHLAFKECIAVVTKLLITSPRLIQ